MVLGPRTPAECDDEHPTWGLQGRCVGHGGFPYDRPHLAGIPTQELVGGNQFLVLPSTGTVPRARVLDGPNPYLGRHARRYGPNGYVVIEVNGTALEEQVCAPDGSVLHAASLTSKS